MATSLKWPQSDGKQGGLIRGGLLYVKTVALAPKVWYLECQLLEVFAVMDT